MVKPVATATTRKRALSSSKSISTSIGQLKDAAATAAATDVNPVTSKNNYLEPKQHTPTEFVESWITHDSVQFHSFSEEEAFAIRNALLTWYRTHRRKLPWRGDPPPWQGSTVDFGKKQQQQQQEQEENTTSNNNKNGTKTKKKKQQTSMTQFLTSAKPTTTTTTTTTKSKTISLPEEITSTTTTTTTTITKDDPFSKTYPITAYGVWVSEIMLQQTRVEAVIQYWVLWMHQFPTIQTLAAASSEQVNAAWAGLGFYRRARLLHQAAQMVVKEYNNENIPNTVDGLLQLPGIGRYTASAIASIVFDRQVPVVDGNVCRVLSRLRGIAQTVKAPALKDQHGWELAQQIIQATTTTTTSTSSLSLSENHCAGEVNQALMELGATFCAPAGTGIDPGDPLRDFYWSTRIGQAVAQADSKTIAHWMSLARSGDDNNNNNNKQKKKKKNTGCPVCDADGVATILENLVTALDEAKESAVTTDQARKCGHSVFPLAPAKTAKREEVLAVAAISCILGNNSNNDNKLWLLVRRPPTGLLAGQWEFPAACVWNSDDDDDDVQQSTSGKKRKDMSDQVPVISAPIRKKALNKLLQELGNVDEGRIPPLVDLPLNQRKSVGTGPLEHIFSHVRHTMWVEHTQISKDDNNDDNSTNVLEWTNCQGRQVRWMNESDMKAVGVTSGVKKILKAVEQLKNSNGKTKTIVKDKKSKIPKIAKGKSPTPVKKEQLTSPKRQSPRKR